MFGDEEIVCQSDSVAGSHGQDLVGAVAVEGCPLNGRSGI